jgi:hypothetical protein
MNFPTFDHINDNTWNGDTLKGMNINTEIALSSRPKIEKHVINRGFSDRNQMEKRMIHTGSFENYLDPVYDERNSLTEQRETRKCKKLQDGRKGSPKRSNRRISDQGKLTSQLSKNLCVADSRAPINKNSDSYKRKFMKKKKKTNSIQHINKDHVTTTSSQHSRINSKTNI